MCGDMQAQADPQLPLMTNMGLMCGSVYPHGRKDPGGQAEDLRKPHL